MQCTCNECQVSSCFDGCWIAPMLENEVNRVLHKICKQLMKEPVSLDVEELMKKKKTDTPAAPAATAATAAPTTAAPTSAAAAPPGSNSTNFAGAGAATAQVSGR